MNLPAVYGRITSALARGGWSLATLASAGVVWGGTRVDFGQAPALLKSAALAGLAPASLYLALVPGFAALSLIATRRRDLGPAATFGIIVTAAGAAGLATFWAWFANPQFGTGVSLGLLGASSITLSAFGLGSSVGRLQLYWPLATAAAVELIYLGLAFAQGGLSGQSDAATQSIAVRFWVAPDNKIPFIVANLLAAHHSLAGYLFGGWQTSDRPPLQSGLALLEYPLFGNRDLGYQVLATGLQMLWLPALWVLFQALGFSHRRIIVPVLITATTGAVFVNSIYVWPKMLAGALMLAALAALVSRSPGDRRFGSILIASSASILAFLSHGSAAFTIIGLAPLIAIAVFRHRAWFEVGVAAVVGLALYLPWFVFQRLVDPPGDRLLYWQLAGLTSTSATRQPFLQALLDQYRAAGPVGVLLDKAGNIAGLIARPDLWVHSAADPAWTQNFLGLARVAQLTDPLCAAGPLVLGLFVLVRRRRRQSLAPLLPVVWFAGLSAAAWVLVQFGSRDAASIISQGPYAILVLLLGGLALSVTYLPWRYATLLVGISLAWFIVEWLPGASLVPAIGQLPGTGAVEKAMVLVSLLGVAGVGGALYGTLRPGAVDQSAE